MKMLQDKLHEFGVQFQCSIYLFASIVPRSRLCLPVHLRFPSPVGHPLLLSNAPPHRRKPELIWSLKCPESTLIVPRTSIIFDRGAHEESYQPRLLALCKEVRSGLENS